MWSLLSRNRTGNQRPSRHAKWRRSVPLSLEQLETRDCPSGFLLDSFAYAMTGVGRQVQLMGSVDVLDTPSTVTFSGKIVGSATTDQFGRFDVIETASGVGLVTAIAYNSVYGYSNSLSVTLQVVAPVTSIDSVVYGSQLNRTVTINGFVGAGQPAGLTVTLGGVLPATTVTNANGYFTYTGNASGPGNVTAQATDIWGQQSNIAQTYVNGIVPVISNFQVTQNGYGQWVASGTVTGGDVSGLTVSIGGVGSGSGTVSGGSFSFVITLSGNGTVTAVTTNGWGQTSNTATYYV